MQKNNEAWNSLFEAEGRRESITMNSLKYWRDGEGKKWKLSLIVGNDSYTIDEQNSYQVLRRKVEMIR